MSLERAVLRPQRPQCSELLNVKNTSSRLGERPPVGTTCCVPEQSLPSKASKDEKIGANWARRMNTDRICRSPDYYDNNTSFIYEKRIKLARWVHNMCIAADNLCSTVWPSWSDRSPAADDIERDNTTHTCSIKVSIHHS